MEKGHFSIRCPDAAGGVCHKMENVIDRKNTEKNRSFYVHSKWWNYLANCFQFALSVSLHQYNFDTGKKRRILWKNQ